MEKVLVTGGAGYVGSTLVPRLLDEGFAVRVLDCLLYGKESLLSVAANENFELFKGRIENRETVEEAVKGVDSIIHLADLSNDPACALNPKLSLRIVQDGTDLLLDCAKKAGVRRFIYASSCSVYGNSTKKNLTEEIKPDPVSLYSEMKARNEKAVLASDSKDFDACCLRKATLCGYSPRLRFDLVVNIMTAHAVRTGSILVLGEGLWRPNMFVGDAAEGYLAFLKAKQGKVKGQVYNFGGNNLNHSILEIAKIVQSSVPGSVIRKDKTNDLRSYHLCFDKVKREIGFEPKHDVKHAVLTVKRALLNNMVSNFKDPLYTNVKQMVSTGFADDA